MDENKIRDVLKHLIEERGEDYARLSRMIGRNAAYVQQYIKRGTPRRLAEEDRRILAHYFDVPERVLGGSESVATDHVIVPQLDVGASAGGGCFAEGERALSHIAFDSRWLRRLGAGNGGRLSIIRVEGDSMMPTLINGDEIMVDQGDRSERLREGIYVLRRDNALMVKRLALDPIGKKVTIHSDNLAYPSWPDCPIHSIDIVGRVVWCGRRFL